MSLLDGLDLEAMTELDLRDLNRRLGQERLRDAITIGEAREIREEQLMIQTVLSSKQAARAAGYKKIADETPGAISTNIKAVPAGADGGAKPPQ